MPLGHLGSLDYQALGEDDFPIRPLQAGGRIDALVHEDVEILHDDKLVAHGAVLRMMTGDAATPLLSDVAVQGDRGEVSGVVTGHEFQADHVVARGAGIVEVSGFQTSTLLRTN